MKCNKKILREISLRIFLKVILVKTTESNYVEKSYKNYRQLIDSHNYKMIQYMSSKENPSKIQKEGEVINV